MSELLNQISQNLQKGKAKIVKELVENALNEGILPRQILDDGLLSGMEIIGEKFKNNEIYVPEVMIAAKAMNIAIEVLKPHLDKAEDEKIGKVLIGTVKGDLHDIGKNLVKIMLQGKGLDVIDLGTDVSAEQFFEAYQKEQAGVICCSALLTTTMNEMKAVVEIFEKNGLRDKVKIMVGGAPVTDNFRAAIGADGYTPDAASAADMAKSFFME